MATPYEWRIDTIEQKAQRAYDSLWKLDTLSSNVDNLERSLRETITIVNELRSALETANSKIEQLERINEEQSLK